MTGNYVKSVSHAIIFGYLFNYSVSNQKFGGFPSSLTVFGVWCLLFVSIHIDSNQLWLIFYCSKMQPEQLTPVQEFYKGKTIFITGASGFMGKVCTCVSSKLFEVARLKMFYFSSAGFDREIAVLLFGIERDSDFGAPKTRQGSRITFGRYVQNSGELSVFAKQLRH